MTKEHVIANYVRFARLRGDRTIQVRVGDVLKQLGWTNRTPSVFSTLNSQAFQKEAGLELLEKHGGPSSGGPSTTWVFTYKLIDAPQSTDQAVVANGAGLSNLKGILRDVLQEFGGGEAYLKAEREWGPDPWERVAEEKRTDPGDHR
ncbi:hypothetical protein DYQ86_23085 [Acidobacteria bacterium AB60]|nr:hypothetical protein DYQ86_23085 [Acidobacteria bacterium AB60]